MKGAWIFEDLNKKACTWNQKKGDIKLIVNYLSVSKQALFNPVI